MKSQNHVVRYEVDKIELFSIPSQIEIYQWFLYYTRDILLTKTLNEKLCETLTNVHDIVQSLKCIEIFMFIYLFRKERTKKKKI